MSSQVILLSEKHTFRTTSIKWKRKEYCNQLHGGMEVGFQQFLGSSVLRTGWQHQIILKKWVFFLGGGGQIRDEEGEL